MSKYNSSKDSIIKTNRYEVNNGTMLINRNANFKQQLRIIPKSQFKKSYETSFFVKRQIAIRRLSVMMGCDPNIGEDSPFRKVLSKDVTRWFLKKYITPETQCFVTTKPVKVWITKDLKNQDFDIVFSEISIYNNTKYIVPHIITTELVMYPVVIQTPKIGLVSCSFFYDGAYRVKGIFDKCAKKTIEEFTNIIDIIDVRCKELLLQNFTDITGERRAGFRDINSYYTPSHGKLIVDEIGCTNSIGLSLSIRDSDNSSFFDKDGCPSKKPIGNFFYVNYATNKYKWVKFIVVLDTLSILNGNMAPKWKVLQVREVESPKKTFDYGFLSSDDE